MSGMNTLKPDAAIMKGFVRYIVQGCVLFGACHSAAHSEQVIFTVTDAAGQPVADAVVYAEHAVQAAPVRARAPSQAASIEQRARKFIPLVTVVQTGTPVSFPNNDKVRHQVYSFSPAKTFELKLYSGIPAEPVVFDKPGTVAIGCNIHDKMVTYVHVVDTPYFAKTDAAGKAVLDGLSPGSYVIKTWHYAASANASIVEQPLRITAPPGTVNIKLDINANAVIK